jgi:hypothetical protein
MISRHNTGEVSALPIRLNQPSVRSDIGHMMFKLGQCAEKKWRRLRGFDYLAKAIIGIKFKDGVGVTAVDQVTA